MEPLEKKRIGTLKKAFNKKIGFPQNEMDLLRRPLKIIGTPKHGLQKARTSKLPVGFCAPSLLVASITWASDQRL